jgi:hypothetical protein
MVEQRRRTHGDVRLRDGMFGLMGVHDVTGAISTRMGPREIHRSAYFVMRYDQARRLIVLTRTAEPYPSLEVLRETFAHMDGAVAHIWKQKTCLLIDSRRSPARNDPAFEAEFRRLRQQFLRDLQKVATVVTTAVGVLQVARHMRVDEMPVGVFTDVAEALAYLGVSMPPEFVELAEGT